MTPEAFDNLDIIVGDVPRDDRVYAIPGMPGHGMVSETLWRRIQQATEDGNVDEYLTGIDYTEITFSSGFGDTVIVDPEPTSDFW